MNRASPCFGIALLLCLLPAGGIAQVPPAPETAAAPAAANLGQPFATKSARFEPRSFDALPGWERDDLGEAAEGMRQSCAALRRKPVWGQLCRTFEHIDRSEEHTSELQSLMRNSYAVFCLKKKI